MSHTSLLGRKVIAVSVVLTFMQTAAFSQTPLSTLIDNPNDFLTAGNLTFNNFRYTPLGGFPLQASDIRVVITEPYAFEGLLFEANWPGRAGPIPGDFARIEYDVYVAGPTSEFSSTIIGASLDGSPYAVDNFGGQLDSGTYVLVDLAVTNGSRSLSIYQANNPPGPRAEIGYRGTDSTFLTSSLSAVQTNSQVLIGQTQNETALLSFFRQQYNQSVSIVPPELVTFNFQGGSIVNSCVLRFFRRRPA